MIRLQIPRCSALLAALLFAGSLVAQQSRYRITGTVVSARDGSPIVRCRMTASPIERTRNAGREPIQTEADDRGHFALDLPAEGHWRLSAAARNFRNQAFDVHDGFSSAIVLTPAQPTYDLVFRAVPDAVLSGVVTDEAGEPVRNANINLFGMDASASLTGGTPVETRVATQTDDRGRYELAGLSAGSYMVNVQTRPWYAASGTSLANPASPVSSLDPSLDFVYPIVWYPGVTDDASASQLAIVPGDRVEADFSLVPLPSARLRVAGAAPLPSPRPSDDSNGVPSFRRNRPLPSVTQILPNGIEQPAGVSASIGNTGEISFDGLAPGLYQVTRPASGEEAARSSIVRISAAGGVTLLDAASNETALTLTVDGDTRTSPSEISLTDTATGRIINSDGGFARRGGRRRNIQRPSRAIPARHPRDPDPDADDNDEAGMQLTLQVPPGRYEVAVSGDASAFLTGLSATGSATSGRFVTIGEAPTHLAVHLASGFATIDGFALIAGRPAVGALVLLVPATLGDPASLAVVQRDQTDTDGGFHISSVIPGRYILVAIDHGWAVNWQDAATLRHYLLQGTPLDLSSAAAVHPRIKATAP